MPVWVQKKFSTQKEQRVTQLNRKGYRTLGSGRNSWISSEVTQIQRSDNAVV